MLGWVIADIVYHRYDERRRQADRSPQERRQRIALAAVAEEIDIGAYMLLGKGEDAAGGRTKPSILSDAMEAVIGAVYIDGGTEAAYGLVERLVGHRLTTAPRCSATSTTRRTLQELSARLFERAPVYTCCAKGPDHAKQFHASVRWTAVARRGRRSLEEAGRAGRARRRARLWAPPSAAVRTAESTMPELPEVETVRRGLAERVVGRRITSVEVGRERTVRRTSREALVAGLTDYGRVSAGRRGKYLLPARLRRCADDPPPHERPGAARARRRLAHRTPMWSPTSMAAPEELWFVDPRTFGEVVVFDPTRGDRAAGAGKDGGGSHRRWSRRAGLRTLLLARRRQLKPLLLDQHVIAGIGNIYVDEILHRSRIHPLRTSDTLSGQEITAAAPSIHDVLVAAIVRGLDARRQPVRGPDGVRRRLSGRPPGLRPCRAALRLVRHRRHRADPVRRSVDPLLPPMPADAPRGSRCLVRHVR